MNAVYKIAGVSKQAYFKQQQVREKHNSRLAELLVQVDLLRAEHPGCGVEKMYHTLRPDWLGRDHFIATFMELGYRVRKIKNYTRTTLPGYLKYPNLIEGLVVRGCNHVWQSDITYFQVGNRFYYLVFIVDIYTKVIVGHQVSNHLRTEANLAALKMALKQAGEPVAGLIHHSDRGSQYTDKAYTALLESKGVHISMGLKAQENAYAERVNGIIKNEYLAQRSIVDFNQLQRAVKNAVNHYNKKRNHGSLRRMPPKEFEAQLLHLNDQNRPTVIVYTEGNYKIREASSHPDFKPEPGPRVHVCPMVAIK